VFRLRRGVTTIGSDPGSDIRLPGLAARHAEIRHDDRDEFVLVRLSRPGATRVNGAPVDEALLRTGTGVQVGDWALSFFREEYADHGRPYGGRIGGELGHQRTQPPRLPRQEHPA
jgi:pSer/pThr/pTyr-binding forkhead associated (FHA) protein